MESKKVNPFALFLTGGIIYFFLEIFIRGYSHISMLILGGVCFMIVGKIGNVVLDCENTITIKIVTIMLMASLIITALEYFTGVIVNEYLNLRVWDYSKMRFNYKGQICLLYSVLWAILGLPCVYFYGVISSFVLNDDEDKT